MALALKIFPMIRFAGSGDFHGPSDCPTLADGNYAMSACGHQFLACSNGLPHVMDCPANLVYNWNVDQCDWPHDMGCEGGSGSDEPVSEESGRKILARSVMDDRVCRQRCSFG